MIKQVRVSHGLRRFKKGLMERWNLEDYHDKDAPCLFFNINGKEDIDAVKNHKGFKLIFFGNARGNQFIESLIGIKDLVVIYNGYLNVPKNIQIKDMGNATPFEIRDYSIFRPNKLGNKIYAYIGNDKQKEKYGYSILKNLQKSIKYEIIFGLQGHTIEYVKQNYYDNCFLNLNLNLSGGGGITTATELAFMGRKTIMNTKFRYPFIIPHENDEDIIRLINQEAQKINTIQPGFDHHTVGVEWQSETFWMTKTYNIDDLLCNRAAFLANEGYAGKPLNNYPFYNACVKYLAGNKAEGKQIYFNHIKGLFDKYGDMHMSRGGIDGLWWVKNIKKHPSINYGIRNHVEYCFSLVDSIAAGYEPYKKPILVRKVDDKYYLSDGHHRICILYALGYKNVENVKIKKL